MTLDETRAPWPARDSVRITGVRTVVTAPEGVNLVVVRVDTSEPGLYGLGCGTFTSASPPSWPPVYPDAVHGIFPGTPVIRAGYAYASDAPGWGVDLDEKLAAAHPPVFHGHERWPPRVRRPDGGIEAP